MQKIEISGKDLSRWNWVHLGNVRKKKKKEKLLKEAEDQSMLTGVNYSIRALQKEIKDIMDKENRLWFQWAKVLWASNGDKNSILRIWNLDGQWRTNPNEMNRCLIDYFQELFTLIYIQNSNVATNSINSIISNDMNALLAEFMESEVQVVLQQMAPLKAPGPNGVLPLFYQHFWSLSGNDVSKSVLIS